MPPSLDERRHVSVPPPPPDDHDFSSGLVKGRTGVQQTQVFVHH